MYSCSSHHDQQNGQQNGQKIPLKASQNSSDTKKIVHIPEAVQILETVLGSSQALLQLVQQFGGCTVRIPVRWPPRGKPQNYFGHPFRCVLTPKQMGKIVNHFKGTDLYVPKCQKYIQLIRNNSIIKSYCKETQKGVSSGQVVQHLAKRHALTDRRIWGILKMNLPQMQDTFFSQE